MATATKLNWIKECLITKWENCSEEELAALILHGDADAAAEDVRRATVQMAKDWQNNAANVRGKFQILKQNDSEELLEKFIRDHITPKKA